MVVWPAKKLNSRTNHETIHLDQSPRWSPGHLELLPVAALPSADGGVSRLPEPDFVLMPRWTTEQFNAYQARHSGPVAVVEPNPSHAPLGTIPVQEKTGARICIRVLSIRRRLLDTDNLCEKFFIDQLRYHGFITDDNPGLVTIETSQRKAISGEEERTEIVLSLV